MHDTITRRRLLGACGAAATAGCLGGGDPPLGLRRIELTNRADTDVTVDVTVRRDGRLVYDDAVAVGGARGERVVQLRRDWMGDRVPYEARFETVVDGRRLEASSDSFALVGENGDYGETACFTLHADVYPDDVRIAHEFAETCATPTTVAAPDRRLNCRRTELRV